MFIPSTEKKIITENYDMPLLMELQTTLGRKLEYIGLPGPMMNDILTWHELLSSCVCIEKDEASKDLMIRTAHLSGIFPIIDINVIHDDIENYIINKLINSSLSSFDVINLDYFGAPIVLNSEGDSKRHQAWQSLFAFQKQSGRQEQFVIIVTTSVRNKDDGQIDTMLEDIMREVQPELVPSEGDQQHLKMKVIVPYMMRDAAAKEKWDLELKQCHTYVGNGNTRMVHFAFLATRASVLVVRHKQTMEDICRFKLEEISRNIVTPLG